MEAILTPNEYSEFCQKASILESKNYDLTYTVEKQPDGNYKIQIAGEHSIEELDRLTDV